MHALIVDDEVPACVELRYLLERHPEIRVVAEARGLQQARLEFTRWQIDVVFLDIQLMGEDGFALLPALPLGTRVVFVTAHESHALRAIRFDAIDYLLKPIERPALAETVRRLLHCQAAPCTLPASCHRISCNTRSAPGGRPPPLVETRPPFVEARWWRRLGRVGWRA